MLHLPLGRERREVLYDTHRCANAVNHLWDMCRSPTISPSDYTHYTQLISWFLVRRLYDDDLVWIRFLSLLRICFVFCDHYRRRRLVQGNGIALHLVNSVVDNMAFRDSKRNKRKGN